MIEFMNAISPTFVAFVAVIVVSPVFVLLIHKAFRAAREERKLKYGLEDERVKNLHIEKMATLKDIEGTAVEGRSLTQRTER